MGIPSEQYDIQDVAYLLKDIRDMLKEHLAQNDPQKEGCRDCSATAMIGYHWMTKEKGTMCNECYWKALEDGSVTEGKNSYERRIR